MINIGFYNHTGKVSGAEHMLLLTLGELAADSDYNPYVVCPVGGTLRATIDAIGVPTVAVDEVQARFTYNPLKLIRYVSSVIRSLRQVRRALIQRNPDCIHANSVRAGLISTLATHGTTVPVIWHIHDMLPNHPVTWALRTFAHASPRVFLVACSKAAADTMMPMFGLGHTVSVIHNGIDMATLRPDEQVRRRKREELGIREDEFLVGSVGMISKRKAQGDLIWAAAKVRSTLPKMKLLIVGSPIFDHDSLYLASLLRDVEALDMAGSISFVGQRQDAKELIQAMDVFVLTSLKEPFAIVLLEALALGKAVVATDCGGPGEVIRSGENGIIVPVGDHQALGDQLQLLHDDPARRKLYGEKAERVRTAYDKRRYIEQWDQLYREIASQPKLPTGEIHRQTNLLIVGK